MAENNNHNWKSRKLWVFIGISGFYSVLTTFLLWQVLINEETWKSINTMILTVGFSVFVLGNLAEKWINGGNGK